MDQPVNEQDQLKTFKQATLQQHFDDLLVKPLESIIAAGPKWIAEIEEFAPTVQETLQKLARTKYATGLSIAVECRELTGDLGNIESIKTGLAEYEKLTPRSLLDRKGIFDINAAPPIRARINVLLVVGNGCTKSMVDKVERIEARVKYLMEHEKEAAALYGPEQSATAEIVAPLDKPDGVKVLSPLEQYGSTRSSTATRLNINFKEDESNNYP